MDADLFGEIIIGIFILGMIISFFWAYYTGDKSKE